MADLYTDLQGVASDVLSEFKQGTIEYVTYVAGDGPVDDPGQPREVVKPLEGTARGASFTYVQKGMASAGDFQATVAVPDFDLSSGFIRLDKDPSREYKIKKIDPKPAVGTPVAYTLIFGDE